MDLTHGTLVGKYRLESPLAQGGMGALWMARHVRLGTPVAIKFLTPALATSRRSFARFEREAHAATLIQSPHVVQIHDFGVEQETPYLVMELLVGESLGQRLSRDRRLPLDETARILIQVGKALRRAHAAGIVHRDLKPGNLFLANDDDEEIVKVLDFGIAKEPDTPVPEQTEPGTMLGSPNYMSPEQAAGDRTVDHRSDLWSLAVVLYQAITGELPFQGHTMGSVLKQVYLSSPRRVTEIDPELPPELDDFFHKALAKKRHERFQSIDDMVLAFVSVAAPDEHIPPPSIGRPAPKSHPCSQAEEVCSGGPVPDDPFDFDDVPLPDSPPSAPPPPSSPRREAPTVRLGPDRSAPQSGLSVSVDRRPGTRLASLLPWLLVAFLSVPLVYGLFRTAERLRPVARTFAARLLTAAVPDSPPPTDKPSPEPVAPADGPGSDRPASVSTTESAAASSGAAPLTDQASSAGADRASSPTAAPSHTTPRLPPKRRYHRWY